MPQEGRWFDSFKLTCCKFFIELTWRMIFPFRKNYILLHVENGVVLHAFVSHDFPNHFLGRHVEPISM